MHKKRGKDGNKKMILLVFIAIAFLLYMFISLRVCIFHPFKFLFYILIDTFFYLKRKKWRECPSGYIDAYTGLFGRGKTLSAVHRCIASYKQYNDKKVWCKRRKKFVIQKIHIISNVTLNIPYESFVSLKQLVLVADTVQDSDDENDTLTVTIALADELSVQMNSRNFKNNIDALFLNTILTCRHFNMGLIYTAQRFNQVDALLRQVTQNVIECRKYWRSQTLNYYDAWQMENSASPDLLKAFSRKGWFVSNKDYDAYDTFATVDNLQKSCISGDMLSANEILELQCNQGLNMDAVLSPSKKFIKRVKKMARKR